MQIKALTTFVAYTGQMHVFNAGDVGELPDQMARRYIEDGQAEPFEPTLADMCAAIVDELGNPMDIPEGSLADEPGTINPLDHDGDGEPGGSIAPADPDGDLHALRTRYEELADKRVFNGWNADTLRAKIAALEADLDDAVDTDGDAPAA